MRLLWWAFGTRYLKRKSTKLRCIPILSHHCLGVLEISIYIDSPGRSTSSTFWRSNSCDENRQRVSKESSFVVALCNWLAKYKIFHSRQKSQLSIVQMYHCCCLHIFKKFNHSKEQQMCTIANYVWKLRRVNSKQGYWNSVISLLLVRFDQQTLSFSVKYYSHQRAWNKKQKKFFGIKKIFPYFFKSQMLSAGDIKFVIKYLKRGWLDAMQVLLGATTSIGQTFEGYE